jgi:hypothetical protein
MDTCNTFPGTKENKPIRNKMVANMFQLLTIFVKINIVNLYLQTVFSTQLTSVLRKKWKGMSFFFQFMTVLRKYY